MKKADLMKKVGSMQQIAYVRPIEYTEGRSENLHAVDVKNGLLSYRVLTDKCLDIGECSFKGINIDFLSKPGLQGRNHYDTHGEEALHSIMGGLFFTAGLENICAPFSSNGKDYPMHGRIRTTPAEHVCSDAKWVGDDYVMTVSGEMREAELFGENMVLRRKIETVYGTNTITITDEIENESYREEPLMLLYHINMGYPLLDEGTEFVIPTKKVTPRDEDSCGHEDRYHVMDAPKDNEPEYVFIHDVVANEDGNVVVGVINKELSLGIRLEFTQKYLPYFMEWKSTASGDYVVGLEPSNSSVYGRAFHEKEGNLHKLGSFEKETNVLKFTVVEGQKALDLLKEEVLRVLDN